MSQWYTVILLSFLLVHGIAADITPLFDPSSHQEIAHLIEKYQDIKPSDSIYSSIYGFAKDSNFETLVLTLSDPSQIPYNVTRENGDVLDSRVDLSGTNDRMQLLIQSIPEIFPSSLTLSPLSAPLASSVEFASATSHDEVRTCAFIAALLTGTMKTTTLGPHDISIPASSLSSFLACCPSATALLPQPAATYTNEATHFSAADSARLKHGCGFARAAPLPPPLPAARDPATHVSLVNLAALRPEARPQLRDHIANTTASTAAVVGGTAPLSLAGPASAPIVTGPHSPLQVHMQTVPRTAAAALTQAIAALLAIPSAATSDLAAPLALSFSLARTTYGTLRVGLRVLVPGPHADTQPSPLSLLPPRPLPVPQCLCASQAALSPAGYARTLTLSHRCPRACLAELLSDAAATRGDAAHDASEPGATTVSCVARSHLLLPEAAFADPYQQLQADPHRAQVSHVASFADVEAVAGAARGLQVAVDTYFSVDAGLRDASSSSEDSFSWRTETTVFGRYVAPGDQRPAALARDAVDAPNTSRSAWSVSAGAVQLWCALRTPSATVPKTHSAVQRDTSTWREVPIRTLGTGAVRGSVPVGDAAQRRWVSVATGWATCLACVAACAAVLRVRGGEARDADDDNASVPSSCVAGGLADAVLGGERDRELVEGSAGRGNTASVNQNNEAKEAMDRGDDGASDFPSLRSRKASRGQGEVISE